MKRTIAVFAAAAFVLLGMSGVASADPSAYAQSLVECGTSGNYTGCIAYADAYVDGHGHHSCSDYWTDADCYAGCHGNGIVGGSECKQLGNGITTPGNLGDGGKGKGDGGNGGGGIGPDGGNGGGGKGPGGGLAVTGSEAASMAILGAGLVGLGGLAIVSAKRREADAS